MMEDKWNESTNVLQPEDQNYIPRSFLINSKTKEKVLISARKFIIGRSDDCDLTIDDDNISRIHCSINDSDASFILEDLDSTNGTFVDNVRIKKRILKEGDMFSIGGYIYSFHFLDVAKR